MTSWKKSDFLIALLGVVGFGIFSWAFRFIYPESQIHIYESREERIDGAADFVDNLLGYSVKNYPIRVHMKHDQPLIRSLQSKYGIQKSNRLMHDQFNAFFWQYSWRIKGDPDSLRIELGGNVRIEDYLADSLIFETSLDGDPISFTSTLKNRDSQPDIKVNDRMFSLSIAQDIFHLIYEQEKDIWTYIKSDSVYKTNGIQYQFLWEKLVTRDDKLQFKVEVYQGKVRHFRTSYQPETISNSFKKAAEIYDIVSFIIVFLFFVVLFAIYFIKWLRSDQLDLKNGLIPAFFVLIAWSVQFVGYEAHQRGWEILLGFLITAPFVCAAVWIIYCVGESMSRTVWPRKIEVLDKLRKNCLFVEFGLTLLRGLALSGIGLALLLFVNYIGVDLFHGYINISDDSILQWSNSWPAASVIGQVTLNLIFILGAFLFFFQPYLKRMIGSVTLRMIVAVLFWSFIELPVPQLAPFTHGFFQNILLGVLLILILIRYNFLTAFITAFGMPLFYYGIVSLQMHHPIYMMNGFVLLGILFVVLIWGILSLRAKELSHLTSQYVPEYMRRIYEKEQLKKELEIARQIQINFLPRHLPQMKGLDIASLCIPARDVGGDYYDFVTFSQNRLGVVIGDVSGKGIPAAFYMTLTKGLFLSQAICHESPRQIMINLNRLFYQNAERGIFISLIYAIFDLEKRTLMTTRAGHNPMILRRKEEGITQELFPAGMALGFDKGSLFQECIEETTIPIRPNDVFLLYTDGLNEAQNHNQKEFGETRLMRVFEQNSHLSSKEIMGKIQTEIKKFTENAKQHDDMTAVIIKVNDQDGSL